MVQSRQKVTLLGGAFFKDNFLDVLFITLSYSAMTENLVSSPTGNYDSRDTTERNV